MDRMHVLSGACDAHGEQEITVPKAISTWHCPICADEKHVAATRQAWAEERMGNLLQAATVPEKYLSAKFEPVPKGVAHRGEQVTVKHVAKTFLDKVVAGDGWATLILCGEAGTGKTLLASELTMLYMQRTLRTARYITASGLIGEIHVAYRDDTKTEAGEIRKFANYDLLVIDEIDLIRANENSQGLLTEVINARYNNNKPVVVITNKPREELGKYVGSRVDDRLYENGYMALFTWPSFRRTGIQ